MCIRDRPIGGPALDDSGVKTVQWREREGHDSYQEVEVYIYGLRARKGGRQKDFVLLKWKSDTSWKAERKTETDVN